MYVEDLGTGTVPQDNPFVGLEASTKLHVQLDVSALTVRQVTPGGYLILGAAIQVEGAGKGTPVSGASQQAGAVAESIRVAKSNSAPDLAAAADRACVVVAQGGPVKAKVVAANMVASGVVTNPAYTADELAALKASGLKIVS